MKTIEMICSYCNLKFNLKLSEFNRKRKTTNFFCSLSCCAKYSNITRTSKIIVKNCIGCGKKFQSNTKAKSAKYCSRSCASLNSVTEYRRIQARIQGYNNSRLNFNTHNIAKGLLKRELYRYSEIIPFLTSKYNHFEFEYTIQNFIFDLYIKDINLIIEFDNKYHCGKQLEIDNKKDIIAKSFGCSIVRVITQEKIISINRIIDILK